MSDSVSWRCIEPVIMTVRGKDSKAKNDAYKRLNDGQKAIFSFYVYFNHAQKDVDSFLYYTGLYRSNGFLSEISRGARYFENEMFAQLIDTLNKLENGTREMEYFEELVIKGRSHIQIMDNEVGRNRAYYKESPLQNS